MQMVWYKFAAEHASQKMVKLGSKGPNKMKYSKKVKPPNEEFYSEIVSSENSPKECMFPRRQHTF